MRLSRALASIGVRARLAAGQSDDPDEQEPDRVADAVVAGTPAPAFGGGAEGVAGSASSVQADSPITASLRAGGQPLPRQLAAMFAPRFGRSLASVRIHTHTAAEAAARSIGARAFAHGRHIGFASGAYRPADADGRHLLAHEIAHTFQPSRGLGRVRRQPEPRPTSPPRAESPAAATIERTFSHQGAPSTVQYQLTLSAPGFDGRGARETIPLEKPVLGASMVTVYAVPLDELYVSPEIAEEARRRPEKDRKSLSLLAAGKQPVSPTPSAGTTGATTAGAKQAASADKPAASPTAGRIADAGPSPTTPAQTVYDILGRPVTLVGRAANWGLTTEFTKLSVGAASCGVLRTESGVRLIDAGVQHTAGEVDSAMVDYAIRRLHELAVGADGKPAPIENILITHAHLDHVALLDRITREFVVKEITINLAQLRDSRFYDAAKDIAKNQLELRRKQLTDELKQTYDKWKETDAAKARPEEGAKQREFERYVEREVAKQLADVKPIDVHVLVPGGAGAPDVSVRIGGINLVPHEAAPGAEGGFTAKDVLGTTVLDKEFASAVEAQTKALAKDPTAKLPGSDQFSSNYLLELPDGTKLLVMSDIRSSDIIRSGEALAKAVHDMGGGDVHLLDLSHHFQSGFLKGEAKGPAAKVDAAGLIPASHLSQLTETITKLATRSGGNFAVVSADLAKMDPAVLYLLRSCNVRIMPAVGAADVQFIAAITAKGVPVSGFTSGAEAGGPGMVALIQRTDIALETLRDQLKAADAAAAQEKEDQKAEAEERRAELEVERKPLEEQLADLEARWEAAKAALKDRPPGPSESYAQRKARSGDLRGQVEAQKKKIREAKDAATKELRDIVNRVGPMQQRRQSLVDQINDIQRTKEALLSKVKASSRGPNDPKPEVKPGEPSPFASEEQALADRVDPLFAEAVKTQAVPRITETSLVVLGKNVQRTEENAELLDAWDKAQQARAKAASLDATVGDHADLVERLQQLKATVSKRPDLADQLAVEHELEFIDQQIAQSQTVLKQVAEKVGTHTQERSPITGQAVDQILVPKETTAQAQGEVAGKPTRLEAGVNAGAAAIGRAMGGVMVIQSFTAGDELLKRYEEGQANLPETALGVTKSAYGVTLGLRMLGGMHVPSGEFIILSALDIAQTALGDYSSTAEYDTEVAYAIIRNGLSIALMYVGMELMAFGPFGIIAGLALMLLGDTILDVLGVKAWLARKFDPRPDEVIDVDETVQSLLKEYAITIGSTELQAMNDPGLAAIGAGDPEAVRTAAREAIAEHRWQLVFTEKQLIQAFEAAYQRARTGHMSLKWLDDQRARFLTLFLKVHRDDDIPEAEMQDIGGGTPAPLSKQQVLDRISKTEEIVSLQNLTADEVPKMEQWSKMDDTVGDLEKYLYRTDYDDIDWMKVYEASSMLEQEIANARYRLEPDKQGSNRVLPLIAPASPARTAYESRLLVYENKADVLRERQLDMVMSGGMPSGVKQEGRGYYLGVTDWGDVTVFYDPDKYYAPDYGETGSTPANDALLNRLEKIVLYYDNLVMISTALPEGVTVEKLHSDIHVIQKYSDALVHDGDLKDAIFRIRATRAATVGALERAHRLLDDQALSPKERARLKKADDDFKDYEHMRQIENGYYLPEELGALESRVGVAHSTTVAALLGETKESPQLTEWEHAAVTDDKLEDFHLSTIRDRVAKLGITLPPDLDAPIPGVYCLFSKRDVKIGIRPGEEPVLEPGPYADELVEVYEDAVPLNDAAVAHFGDRGEHKVYQRDLLPVTTNNLLGKTTPHAALDLLLEPQP